MKKKMFAILMSSVMMVSLFGACGESSEAKKDSEDSVESDTDEKKDTASDEEQADGTTVVDENGNTIYTDADGQEWYVDMDGTMYKRFDGVEIDFFKCWNNSSVDERDLFLSSMIVEEIQEKLGITVVLEGSMMNEVEKLNMMFGADDIPDMVCAPYWGGTTGETAVIKKACEDGMLADISELVPQYSNIANCWDIGVISQAFWDSDINIFDGALYIIPADIAATTADVSNNRQHVYVRKDVAEDLGYTVEGVVCTDIDTSEKLYEFLKAGLAGGYTDVNGNAVMGLTSMHSGYEYQHAYASYVSKNLTDWRLLEDGTVIHEVLADEWIDAHMYMWKLHNEGLADPEMYTQTREVANQKSANGTALAQSFIYNSINSNPLDAGTYEANGIEYVLAPIQWGDGSPVSQLSGEGVTGSHAIFFPADSDKIEACLTWLNYMNSKEFFIRSNYGIEGETFEYNEEGLPRRFAEQLDKTLPEDEQWKDPYDTENGGDYEQGMWNPYSCHVVTKHNMEWTGEKSASPDYSDPFDSVLQYEVMEAAPVEIIPGYAVSGFTGTYEDYADVSYAFSAEKQQEYYLRAYFADTEEEAKQILEEYQDYVANYDGMQDLLDYMTESVANYDGELAW